MISINIDSFVGGFITCLVVEFVGIIAYGLYKMRKVGSDKNV